MPRAGPFLLYFKRSMEKQLGNKQMGAGPKNIW